MSRFIVPTSYNNETKNQMWMSMLADSHDIWCKCEAPFAHLLDSIFPEGHKDKDLTVRQIINRDYKACLSGGDAAANHGMEDGDTQLIKGDIKEEDFHEEDIDTLLAAAAADAEEESR